MTNYQRPTKTMKCENCREDTLHEILPVDTVTNKGEYKCRCMYCRRINEIIRYRREDA